MSEEMGAVETPAEEVVVAPAETPANDGSDHENESGGEEVTATGRPAKGNVFARNRILERENKVILRRLDDLMSRLESKSAAHEEPEPEVVEFREDPLRAIHSRQEKIERELRKEREDAKKRDEERELRQKITLANEAILDFVEETPDYNQAIEHLAQIEFEEALDENPDLSHEQVDMMLFEKLNKQKLRWIAAGKNPGEELYNKAKRRGFTGKPKPAARPKAADAKEEIEAERKRISAGSSIGKAVGRSSEGRVTADKIARMTDEQYRTWADEQVKQRGGGRIRMRDLMADKIRER